MDEVLYGKKGNVASIIINRPNRRNSITSQVVNSLRAYLARSNHDPEIRIITITGAGDVVFCAGGDLGHDAADSGAIARFEANRQIVELFDDMRDSSKPIIGRVNGHALGIGFAILLSCDLVVAVDKIRMGCPEPLVGQFPMLTVSQLSRHLGPKRAMDFLLTGQQVNSTEAERIGLINYSVERDELDLKLEELIARISEFSPIATRLGRKAFYDAEEMTYTQANQYLLSQLTLNLQTEDAKEGIQAFLQKRKPEWKGR